jgi:hypothetical protein
MNPFDLSPYRALYEIPARSINRRKLEGSVNLMGESGPGFGAEQGARVPAERASRTDLAADPALPAETRLWAAVEEVSGGLWGGCVVDVDSILELLAAGNRGIEEQQTLPDWIWKENQCSYTAPRLPGGFKPRPGLAFRYRRMRRTR